MPHTPLLLQIKMALTGAVMWGSSLGAVAAFAAAFVTPFRSTGTVAGLATWEWSLAVVGFAALMVWAMCTLGDLADRDEEVRDAQAAQAQR